MDSAVVLNAGAGAWAFEELAASLARAFGVPVGQTPVQFNYVLAWDEIAPPSGRSFVPLHSIAIATDKRQLARVFKQSQVPIPQTHLFEDTQSMRAFLNDNGASKWVLKWPTGCGGAGHRLIRCGDEIPDPWPRPFVVQRFIEMERPEVFRLYAVAGELFGWNARRLAPGANELFVAHARGAFYAEAGMAPAAAVAVARRALQATGLLASFGCADLLRDPNGDWLALEVNTDGLWMHVDRDAPAPIAAAIEAKLATAFGRYCRA